VGNSTTFLSFKQQMITLKTTRLQRYRETRILRATPARACANCFHDDDDDDDDDNSGFIHKHNKEAQVDYHKLTTTTTTARLQWR